MSPLPATGRKLNAGLARGHCRKLRAETDETRKIIDQMIFEFQMLLGRVA